MNRWLRGVFVGFACVSVLLVVVVSMMGGGEDSGAGSAPLVVVDPPQQPEPEHDPEPEPEAEADPPQENAGTGSSMPPLPDGWTTTDFTNAYQAAASTASQYWLNKTSTRHDDQFSWLEHNTLLSTPAQQRRDQEWVDLQRGDRQWQQQQQAVCYGETWISQGFVAEVTDTTMLIGLPTRQWCTYKAQDPTEAAMEQKRRDATSGIGGWRVIITSFDMKLDNGQWLVDNQDRIPLTVGAP